MSIFYLLKNGTLQPLFQARSYDQALLLIPEQDRDCLRHSAETVLINPYSGKVNFASHWDEEEQLAGILFPASYCIVTERWHANSEDSPFSALSIELWLCAKRLFLGNVDAPDMLAAVAQRLEIRFPGASIEVRVSDADELVLGSTNVSAYEWFNHVSATVWHLTDETMAFVRSKRAPNLKHGARPPKN